MTTAEYFEIIDLNEIERFVAEGQEENVVLEFKTVNHPNENKEFDRKNFSVALSGFGNSNGGIIIWGIETKKIKGQDVASSKKPITELTKFLNFLNRTEGQTVIPIINGVVHKKIEDGADTGYIKTFLPPSDGAPHMALFGGKHYYKRSGDSFYQCEHYDIIDMLSRKRSPDLHLTARVLRREEGQSNKYQYAIVLTIENKGKALAKYPGLSISCDHHYRQYSHGLDGNSRTGLQRVANNTLYRYNYSGGIDTVIYPGMTLDVDKFMTEADKSGAPQDFNITYILSSEHMENRTGELKVDVRRILADSTPMPD
jgi:hypothetical protein